MFDDKDYFDIINEEYSLDKIDAIIQESSSKYSIDYKAELNEEQYEAVMFTDGPALILAGAGTGKTRTITYRVARLVESGVPPESILLLTFTRKAANEMLERAANLLDSRCYKVAGGTYHSFATRVLRKYSKTLGIKSNFTIADQGDSEDIVNLIREELGLSSKERRFPQKKTLNDIFSVSVNTQKSLEEVVEKKYPHYLGDIDDIKKCYARFVEFKKEKNILDYDDLLTYLDKLLKEHPNVKTALSQKFQYIMVDEYQDSNLLQFSILKSLALSKIDDEWSFGAKERCNLMVVGDPNQSIYKWRGAHYMNIVNFPKEFDNTKIIYLNKNYRSTQDILDLSNALMDDSEGDLYNPLKSDLRTGFKPLIVNTANDSIQSKFVTQRVLELREKGISLKDIAVLFRNSHHSAELEILLTKANIPFIKFGGKKFLESAHVKDLIAFIRVLSNPLDTISWFRILKIYKKVGLGEKTMSKIIRTAEDNHDYNFLVSPSFKNTKYEEVLKKLQDILSNIAKLNFCEQISAIADYYIPIMVEIYEKGKDRIDDINSLIEIGSKYKNIDTFLTDVSLDPPDKSDVGEDDKDDECLILSTIHSSKGLEFEAVFLLSCVDGYIPSSRSIGDVDDEAEEKRLLYVAITRAKKWLHIVRPMYLRDVRGTTEITKFFKGKKEIRDAVRVVSLK